MILYHGSNCDISKIDFAMCKPFKDFGQSFYLTSILTQAREMSRKMNNQYAFRTERSALYLQKKDTV